MYEKIRNLQDLLNINSPIEETSFSSFLEDLYNGSLDKSTMEEHILYLLFLCFLNVYYKLYKTFPSFYNKTVEEYYDDFFLSLKSFIDDKLGSISKEEMDLLQSYLQHVRFSFNSVIISIINIILQSIPKILAYTYIHMLFSSLPTYATFLQNWNNRGYNINNVLLFDLHSILHIVRLDNFTNNILVSLVNIYTILGDDNIIKYINTFKHIPIEDFYELQEAYNHLDITKLVKLFSTYSGLHLGYESYFTDEFKNKILSVAETLGVKDEVVKNYPQYFNN